MNEDVIDFLEQKAGLAGEFAGVDEHYVARFLSLTPEDSSSAAPARQASRPPPSAGETGSRER